MWQRRVSNLYFSHWTICCPSQWNITGNSTAQHRRQYELFITIGRYCYKAFVLRTVWWPMEYSIWLVFFVLYVVASRHYGKCGDHRDASECSPGQYSHDPSGPCKLSTDTTGGHGCFDTKSKCETCFGKYYNELLVILIANLKWLNKVIYYLWCKKYNKIYILLKNLNTLYSLPVLFISDVTKKGEKCSSLLSRIEPYIVPHNRNISRNSAALSFTFTFQWRPEVLVHLPPTGNFVPRTTTCMTPARESVFWWARPRGKTTSEAVSQSKANARRHVVSKPCA